MTAARTLVALASLALAVVACGRTEPSATPSPSEPSPATSSPSGSPTTSPTPSATQTLTPVRVPVYWAGDTSRGPLLYREFLDASAPAGASGRAVAALELMLAGQPLDPDYESLWPAAVRVVAVTVDGGTAAVELSGPVPRSARDADSPEVQQLVHTVTAALEGVRAVTLTLDGAELVPGPVSRSPQVDVLAPVWVVDPQDGASVGRPLRIFGAATVFEATVSWEVLQDGSVVRSGFSTATIGAPARGTWSAVVRRLPPGTYDVVAYETSMKDGSRQFVDDKTVTLR